MLPPTAVRSWGFYAITTGAIVRGVLSESMRRNAPDPVSSVLLAQRGVDISYHGQGIGRDLALHAMGQP
jgi:predicted N-acetyltransferase YhbS